MENKDKKKKIVSYSQFSTWFNCPRQFYLDRVMKLKVREDTIYSCFGTAIHEAVQKYIETLYTKSSPEADLLDLNGIFKTAFDRELTDRKLKYEENEYTDFCFDGQDIIKEFCRPVNRMKYFPSGKYEFLGAELKITQAIRNNLEFMALIDIALKDKLTGKIKIIDIKTSTMGWNRYVLADENKQSQILLYKALYSKEYNVPLSQIDVEFFILKRRLLEKVSFPQSRIQIFIPTNTSPVVKKSIKKFTMFVNECFTEDGEYITDASKYPKVPGKNKKHCKYCMHKKVNCDAKSDVKDDEY